MEDKLSRLTETEKAYLAGLVDGEGCITINRAETRCGTPNYTMRVIIAQASRKYLEYWQDKVGMGQLYCHTDLRHVWMWQMCQQEAARFLRAIRLYINRKPDQVDIALKFMATKGKPGGDGYRYRTAPSILKLQEHYRQEIAAIKHEHGEVAEPGKRPELEQLMNSQLRLLERRARYG